MSVQYRKICKDLIGVLKNFSKHWNYLVTGQSLIVTIRKITAINKRADYWNTIVSSIHQAVCNLLNKNLLTTITDT